MINSISVLSAYCDMSSLVNTVSLPVCLQLYILILTAKNKAIISHMQHADSKKTRYGKKILTAIRDPYPGIWANYNDLRSVFGVTYVLDEIRNWGSPTGVAERTQPRRSQVAGVPVSREFGRASVSLQESIQIQIKGGGRCGLCTRGGGGGGGFGKSGAAAEKKQNKGKEREYKLFGPLAHIKPKSLKYSVSKPVWAFKSIHCLHGSQLCGFWKRLLAGL